MGEKPGPNEITSLSDRELRTIIERLCIESNTNWQKLEDLIPYLKVAQDRGTISLAITAEEAERRLDLFKKRG